MSKPTPRLGKGLSALIGNRQHPAPTSPSPAPHKPASAFTATDPPSVADSPPRSPTAESVLSLPLDSIDPNPRQPRSHFDDATLAELAASIKTTGVLQPLVVRKGQRAGRYELVAGERRLRAARQAGLTHVPALLRQMTDQQSLEAALIENLQREDLGPLERAAAYQGFLDLAGGGTDSLAERLGESRSNVANYLRLLKLHPEIQAMITSGDLGMGQARAVAGIGDPQRQLAIARLACRRNLSVRQVEALAREPAPAERAEPAERVALSKHLDEVQQSLSRSLGLPIRLYPGRKKNTGRIVIRYNSLEEFDRLAERIGGTADLV